VPDGDKNAEKGKWIFWASAYPADIAGLATHYLTVGSGIPADQSEVPRH
jgi:hypothetical protein